MTEIPVRIGVARGFAGGRVQRGAVHIGERVAEDRWAAVEGRTPAAAHPPEPGLADADAHRMAREAHRGPGRRDACGAFEHLDHGQVTIAFEDDAVAHTVVEEDLGVLVPSDTVDTRDDEEGAFDPTDVGVLDGEPACSWGGEQGEDLVAVLDDGVDVVGAGVVACSDQRGEVDLLEQRCRESSGDQLEAAVMDVEDGIGDRGLLGGAE